MRMILQIIISNGILDLVTGILAKISRGTGIWAKFRLGTGIWYPPSRPSQSSARQYLLYLARKIKSICPTVSFMIT